MFDTAWEKTSAYMCHACTYYENRKTFSLLLIVSRLALNLAAVLGHFPVILLGVMHL